MRDTLAAMARFFGLLAVMIVTTLGLALFTSYDDVEGRGYESKTQLWGVPLIATNTDDQAFDRPALIVLGGPGVGVLCLGIGGFGLISIGALGGGLLFGLGQGACGLISVGQLSVGPVFALGQLAIGSAALGQGALGLRSRGQGTERRNGAAFMSSLNREISDALRFDWRGAGRR